MSGAEQALWIFYSLQDVPLTMYFDHDIVSTGTLLVKGWPGATSQLYGCVNMSITGMPIVRK